MFPFWFFWWLLTQLYIEPQSLPEGLGTAQRGGRR